MTNNELREKVLAMPLPFSHGHQANALIADERRRFLAAFEAAMADESDPGHFLYESSREWLRDAFWRHWQGGGDG